MVRQYLCLWFCAGREVHYPFLKYRLPPSPRVYCTWHPLEGTESHQHNFGKLLAVTLQTQTVLCLHWLFWSNCLQAGKWRHRCCKVNRTNNVWALPSPTAWTSLCCGDSRPTLSTAAKFQKHRVTFTSSSTVDKFSLNYFWPGEGLFLGRKGRYTRENDFGLL